MSLVYSPPKSLEPFLLSEKFVALQVGPVGSTKTTAGIIKIAYHAKQMAPCTDGVRRSRAIWVRRSRQMLFDTSIKDFLTWFPDGPAGTFSKTDAKFDLRFDDVHCEVLFRPMEDASDINRLLSLQGSFAIFDEFREISPDVFEAMQGRLGRFPDKRMVPPRPEWGVDAKGHPVGGCVTDTGKSNKHLWGMTNPPDVDTYWETLLSDPPDTVDAFFQPSGMSPEADWLQYLPPDYYEDLIKGKSQDYIDVYVHSKFGRSLAGKPVFSAFNTDTHVSRSELTVLPNTTVIIGVDAGLSPAAVIGQVNFQNRVIVHDALVSESMGALRFIREKLKPLIARKYQGCKIGVVIDPAAFQRAQTDERTVADIYKSEGFIVRPAKTNTITARVAAVDQYLTRVVDGHAGMLINKVGCDPLIQAMRGKYRYKMNTKGEIDDSPEKSHPWSDVADGLQYLCLHADNGSSIGAQATSRRRDIKRVAYHYG